MVACNLPKLWNFPYYAICICIWFTAAWIKWGNILKSKLRVTILSSDCELQLFLKMARIPSNRTLCEKIPPFDTSACLLGTLSCAMCFFLKIGGRCTVLKVCSFLPSALQHRASFQGSSAASLLRREELAKCFARSVTSDLTLHNSWVVHSPSSQQMLAQNEIIHD